MMKELKYKIADLLFSKELDETFQMGIREGKAQQGSIIRVSLEYQKNRSRQHGITKAQLIGFEKCMEAVNDKLK
jgi:hypothetical protein